VLELVTFGAVGRLWLAATKKRFSKRRRRSTQSSRAWPVAANGRFQREAVVARTPRRGGCARPSSASPLDAIDAKIAPSRLLAAASGQARLADLYFEYRLAPTRTHQAEGRIRTVGRGVTLGLACACCVGDADGYAYTETSVRATGQAARTASTAAAAC